MYIQPDTNIRLLANCPLDNTYEHTLYCQTLTSQREYFMSLTKYNLTEQSYQRAYKGSMRVQIKAENLYDCNYMMFQNSAFGNKWFYAFITGIEYINNITSELRYEIDVIQTWFFDFHFKETFIEREHAMNDTPNANLQGEPISPGEIITKNLTPLMSPASYKIALICANKNTGFDTPYNGSIQGNIYSCYNVEYYDTAADVNDRLNQLYIQDRSKDLIIGCYMIPSNFVGGGTITGSAKSTPQNVDGYVPRNKKVLSSLYNKGLFTTGAGAGVEFDWYQWSGSHQYNIDFNTSNGYGEAVAYLCNYAGSDKALQTKLTLPAFPQCAIGTDGFNEWLARTATKVVIGGTILATFGAGAGALALGAAEMGAGTITGAMARGAAMETTKTVAKYGAGASAITATGDRLIPQTIATGSPSCSADWQGKNFNFYIAQLCIKYGNAVALDNFFDVYGYATNLVKKPNRSGRPHWNYVKTRKCTLEGSVPADDMNLICKIHDAGITYWNHGGEVGNYALNNGIGE